MFMYFLRYGVGVDMAKEKFDACVSIINSDQEVKIKATRTFKNTESGFVEFANWLAKHCKEEVPVIISMEATGVYFEQLAWWLHNNDNYVSVLLPNRAKRYKESLGLISKNDSIDARALSRMACEQKLKQWHPISKTIYTLRVYTRQIERLNKLIAQLNNQLHALTYGMFRDEEIENMFASNLANFKEQKKLLEKKLAEVVENDDALKSRFEKICDVKGLGLLSVATIVAETNGFALIENRSQLVSYAGYDIIENQSGNRVGKTKISKRGNSHIRKALHMPALNMVRYDHEQFKKLYERIYSKTKIKMKGYVAIQRKLLLLIYTLWKKNEHYKPDHFQISKDVELEPSFVK